MNSPSTEYKTAQRNFYNWATKWTQFGAVDQVSTPDIPEIVTLMKAIGYKIKFFDQLNTPADVMPVAGGGGIRMVITCTHSGQRVCLENNSDCHCPNPNNASFWEVTGSAPNSTQDSIQETGSDMIYSISNGTKYVIFQVINHLFNLITSSDLNQNEPCTPSKPFVTNTTTNESFGSCCSTNLIANENMPTPMRTDAINKPMIKVESPEPPMSPARYRSLDTLTTTGDEELPEPGLLRKGSPTKESLTAMLPHSPEFSGAASRPSSTSSPNRSITFDQTAYMKVKMAQDVLQEVLDMIDHQKNTMTSFDDLSKIKESTESLASNAQKEGKPATKVSKNSKLKPSRYASSPNLTRTSNTSKTQLQNKENSIKMRVINQTTTNRQVKPACRPPIRSTSSVSSMCSVSSVSSTKSSASDKKSLEVHKPSGRRIASSGCESALKGLPLMRKKNLFSNVKSTIPKQDHKK